jgi:uncharacterized protein YbaR (Trm112 family)
MHTTWNDWYKDVLVCPVCRHGLAAQPSNGQVTAFFCSGCGRSYPVQDGIPVLIEARATIRR